MYTIVDDGDEINIRATITQRWELAELVTKLQQRVDGLPVDLTTYVESPTASATMGSQLAIENATGSGATAHLELNKDGSVQSVTLTNGRGFDAQDVNRKELSDE